MSQPPQYPYQNNQFTTINLTHQQQLQPLQLIETKTCKRARGPHTEGEFYCGRILPITSFSKGRAQCKECSSKKTKVYNETKIAAIIQQQSNNSTATTNPEMEESLSKLSTELEQMKIEYQKYYDAALQYHNENLRLKQELDTLTLSNNDLIRKDKLLHSEIEDKTRIIKTNSDSIGLLQKENRELKSENISLLDEIRVLERKR